LNKGKIIFFVSIIFGLLGCATTQLPPPNSLGPQRGVIGISVNVRAPIKVFTNIADMVCFINVDEEEDLYTRGNLIQSNYAKDGKIYLLNAKPGRYAAVIAAFHQTIPIIPAAPTPGFSITINPAGRYSYTTFLPIKMIKSTEVTLVPGGIAFMGDYVVDQSLGFSGADEAQLHYFQLFAPGAKTDVFSMGFSGKCYYKGSLHEEHCGMQDEIDFLSDALEYFKDTGWVNIVQKRLEQLKAEK